jgi:FtsZ-binding cell division protein ZapB
VRTERSQSGLINELEQYHKALQHTTQNLTDVLHTEISHLKETNNNQKIKIEELTKENHTLKQLNTSFSTADEGSLREQLKYI